MNVSKATELGIEPKLSESKSDLLPLQHSAMCSSHIGKCWDIPQHFITLLVSANQYRHCQSLSGVLLSLSSFGSDPTTVIDRDLHPICHNSIDHNNQFTQRISTPYRYDLPILCLPIPPLSHNIKFRISVSCNVYYFYIGKQL